MDCQNDPRKRGVCGRKPPLTAVAINALAGCALLTAAATASAQTPPSDPFLQQQQAIELQVQEALQRDLPPEQKVHFDWGGWYSFFLFLWDDGIESSRTFRQHDFRLWGNASFDQGAHEFYGRAQFQWEDFNSGDQYGFHENDTRAHMERAWYRFDLRRAAKAYWNENLDWNLNVKVGRDLVSLGTGYALLMPMDHVLLTAETRDIRATALMGTTIRSMPDIDLSRPKFGSSERNFWGGQVELTSLEKHVPFFYGFVNKDQKTEHPWVPLQEYDYDSWYLGAGSHGELPIRNLRYSTEIVYEGGESYGHRRFLASNDVEAWAFDFLLDYLMQRPWHPRITGEYMFASGDGNRYGSPTNAVGGNRRGDDTSFVGFGYRDTGLAFAPRLSNVHVWRLGTAVKPLEEIEQFRNLEVGTDWFLYCKHHGTGAVSDPTADQRSNFLGWEMDYFLNWRLTSDLSWTTRFGTFFPGASYSDQTTRTFLLTGVVYSF